MMKSTPVLLGCGAAFGRARGRHIVGLLTAFFLVWMGGGALAADYPSKEDVSTLDGLMRAYYDVVSGPANTPRNVARDLSLHHPDAQMMVPVKDKDGKPMLRKFDVKSFHEWGAPVYENGFYEKEIHRETLSFGRLTHVWSTYETRHSPDGPVVARGINSIQVYFDGTRYWIVAETWDTERDGNAIPARFLPDKSR
jgi:hypothetical protein